ncbi:hypothetical protein CCZ01_01135 [Helicobacter monodelphidis]|uniref:phosphoribosyltransferase n=1 Tax=Helicobacter sp. 15-1451 TaxID=2004995 RepID=UPI000DCEA32C|nr:phosphoribosyltransferase family protein [Helicobacter sp. 15-1451]RAX58828.1 hypothetical protein CCZ01_01135 [Helicobacter sp. 15-1451]
MPIEKDIHSPTLLRFIDRDDALSKLVEVMPIAEMSNRENLVIAISFGGVLFAKKLATILKCPFDVLFTASIPAPLNPECPIAMVSETYDIIIHDALVNAFEVSLDYIYGEAKRRYEEQILSTIYKFRKGEVISSLKGEDVIIVDEGIDSGMTITNVVKSCINHQAKSVSIAVPVMPADVEFLLKDIVDNLYTILRPRHFVEVSSYYERFDVLSSEQVEEILKEGFLVQRQQKKIKEKDQKEKENK